MASPLFCKHVFIKQGRRSRHNAKITQGGTVFALFNRLNVSSECYLINGFMRLRNQGGNLKTYFIDFTKCTSHLLMLDLRPLIIFQRTETKISNQVIIYIVDNVLNRENRTVDCVTSLCVDAAYEHISDWPISIVLSNFP